MTMSRDSRPPAWLLSLLCVALLVVRMGGAHLHLCFDGQEQPQTLHWMDSGIHHSKPAQMGTDAPHQDSDIAVTGELIGKPGKSLFDLPLVLLAVLLPWLALRPARSFRSPLSPQAAPTAPLFLRPPLRGPPLLSPR